MLSAAIHVLGQLLTESNYTAHYSSIYTACNIPLQAAMLNYCSAVLAMLNAVTSTQCHDQGVH